MPCSLPWSAGSAMCASTRPPSAAASAPWPPMCAANWAPRASATCAAMLPAWWRWSSRTRMKPALCMGQSSTLSKTGAAPISLTLSFTMPLWMTTGFSAPPGSCSIHVPSNAIWSISPCPPAGAPRSLRGSKITASICSTAWGSSRTLFLPRSSKAWLSAP